MRNNSMAAFLLVGMLFLTQGIYTQTITVTNASSVVYPDSGFTWVLTQIVY